MMDRLTKNILNVIKSNPDGIHPLYVALYFPKITLMEISDSMISLYQDGKIDIKNGLLFVK